jgi:hypothetical protein
MKLRWPICGSVPKCPGEIEEDANRVSKGASALTEIQTELNQNTSLQRYLYSTLLAGRFNLYCHTTSIHH